RRHRWRQLPPPRSRGTTESEGLREEDAQGPAATLIAFHSTADRSHYASAGSAPTRDRPSREGVTRFVGGRCARPSSRRLVTPLRYAAIGNSQHPRATPRESRRGV